MARLATALASETLTIAQSLLPPRGDVGCNPTTKSYTLAGQVPKNQRLLDMLVLRLHF